MCYISDWDLMLLIDWLFCCDMFWIWAFCSKDCTCMVLPGSGCNGIGGAICIERHTCNMTAGFLKQNASWGLRYLAQIGCVQLIISQTKFGINKKEINRCSGVRLCFFDLRLKSPHHTLKGADSCSPPPPPPPLLEEKTKRFWDTFCFTESSLLKAAPQFNCLFSPASFLGLKGSCGVRRRPPEAYYTSCGPFSRF